MENYSRVLKMLTVVSQSLSSCIDDIIALAPRDRPVDHPDNICVLVKRWIYFINIAQSQVMTSKRKGLFQPFATDRFAIINFAWFYLPCEIREKILLQGQFLLVLPPA